MAENGTPIKSEAELEAERQAAENQPPVSSDPPTPQNPNPSSDGATETEDEKRKRYISILEDTIREQNRKLQAAADAGTTQPPTTASKLTPEEEKQAFYQDPVTVTRNIVNEALDRTIAPLTEFVREFRGQGTTQRLIERFKVDPRFSNMWDSQIEGAVTNFLGTLSPDQINEATVQSAVIQAIGLRAAGLLQGSPGPTPPPTPPSTPKNGNPPVPPTPPHMRPSAPPGPGEQPVKPKLRALTENEERIRRENKQTVEEYLNWLEVPATDVTKVDLNKVRGVQK